MPQWLFAFDAVGATMMRTLAMLAAHPRAAVTVRAELAGRDLDLPQELPYLSACVLETLRVWPTTLAILRDSTVATTWRGRAMPAGTAAVVISSFFHRDRARLRYADAFVPEIWLDGRAAQEPGRLPATLNHAALEVRAVPAGQRSLSGAGR